MAKIDFSENIYPSITGATNSDWQNKLREIEEFKITEVVVFLSMFDKKERNHLYKFLLKSSIKRIPAVHLRHDTNSEDIKFFMENFGTEYFNIHEEFFNFIDQWKGCWERLYLEMNYNNEIIRDVNVKKIGGFCIDLSHFKAAIARGSKEVEYIFSRRNQIKVSYNHISGYNPAEMACKHMVTDLKDFDYLVTLPNYVFGKFIAIEVYNNIKEQLEFKKYLVGLLNNYFKKSK